MVSFEAHKGMIFPLYCLESLTVLIQARKETKGVVIEARCFLSRIMSQILLSTFVNDFSGFIISIFIVLPHRLT